MNVAEVLQLARMAESWLDQAGNLDEQDLAEVYRTCADELREELERASGCMVTLRDGTGPSTTVIQLPELPF